MEKGFEVKEPITICGTQEKMVGSRRGMEQIDCIERASQLRETVPNEGKKVFHIHD